MNISIVRTTHGKMLPPVSELGFGKHFADHMFLVDYTPEQNWHDARIVPYQPFDVEPSNLMIHYGQSIFEGLKAFRWADGSVNVFRLADHAERFARSAERLCMPTFDQQMLIDAINLLVDVDRNWVPAAHGTALYLRPTLIATDNALGVRPSNSYLMFVISSPVGSYYSKGSAPTRILVEESYTRATQGGLGAAKTAANYAASMLAAREAKAKGFDQVLWLDAHEHRFVEEVGTMNIFFVIDDVLITPPLTGTILDGITRRTVLELASEWNLPIEERPISMEEVVAAHRQGTLQEVFGSGTAAVISQVGELFYKGEPLVIADRHDSLRERFYKAITAIHYGDVPDTHGWMTPVKAAATNGHAKLAESTSADASVAKG
jgi:branched-chain amino acid aminotransferase